MEPVRVVADIGGTSSRWAYWQGEGKARSFPEVGQGSWPGFNPVQGDGKSFVGNIHANLSEHAPQALKAEEVFIYGAGCGSEERAYFMRMILTPLFPKAEIRVESDILGAARGLYGTESGLVVILGTGMNVAFYDGMELHRPMPSLGYILGDEGGGADIGRHLVRDVFYRRTPAPLTEALFGAAGPSLPHILNEVYRSDRAARTLAARTKVLAEHISDPYARALVAGRFAETVKLIARFFPKEQCATVKATGSIAWVFADILKEQLALADLPLTDVTRDPLQGLVGYHRR